MLISTRSQDTDEVRSYRIVDSEVTEENVVITDSVP